jgi:hypothetical protein
MRDFTKPPLGSNVRITCEVVGEVIPDPVRGRIRKGVFIRTTEGNVHFYENWPMPSAARIHVEILDGLR